jgi:peptidoglycan/LPS O-acetylase OafA/YrhL
MIVKKDNNFNLVRIYLSLSVLFYHAFELSGQKELSFLNKVFNVDRAVDAFFIISGYLIMKSYERSASNKEYFTKRLRRIYPAYLVIVTLCVLLGFLVSTYPPGEYFRSPQVYKYLLSNVLFLNFLQPDLPGVFDNNLFHAVNGSLWTLKVEIGYYLLVPLIVALRSRIKPTVLYGLLFLFSIAWYLTMLYLYDTRHAAVFLFLSRQLPGELSYFILGAAVTLFDGKPFFRKALTWLGIPAIILLFLPMGAVMETVAGSLMLAIAVFFFALRLPVLHYPFRKEDISYGLYIYHFPVMQTIIQLGVYHRSPMPGLMISLIVTVFLSLLSWFLIEKPFIMKKYASFNLEILSH